MFRALLAQALGDLQTVNTMNPVEAFCQWAGFVGLNRADEMPDDSQMAQCFLFGDGFLQIIFAKVPLSEPVCLFQSGRRPGLPDRNQAH